MCLTSYLWLSLTYLSGKHAIPSHIPPFQCTSFISMHHSAIYCDLPWKIDGKCMMVYDQHPSSRYPYPPICHPVPPQPTININIDHFTSNTPFFHHYRSCSMVISCRYGIYGTYSVFEYHPPVRSCCHDGTHNVLLFSWYASAGECSGKG